MKCFGHGLCILVLLVLLILHLVGDTIEAICALLWWLHDQIEHRFGIAQQ